MKIVARFKTIPNILRMIVIVLWIGGVMLLVGSVIPGWEDASGRSLPYQERWSTGLGFLCLGQGFGMIALAAMIYRARPWVRHLLMGGIVAAALTGFFHSDFEHAPVLFRIFVALIAIGIGVRYFYFRKDVVRFFKQNQHAEQMLQGNQR